MSFKKGCHNGSLFVFCLFNVLDLFADLFNLGLDVKHVIGDGYVIGFGAYGVCLTIHFLDEEVQFFAYCRFRPCKY